ncbi:MAG: hypothetical protein IJI98_03465 [Methanosphaera sp.]|nr:hypothetical protein [Bacilli bacterium]MBR0471741.1 hypothetical protein [Methanosphaera sp.]
MEEQIKKMIIENYGSMRSFSDKIGLPNSTVVSILERGIKNSNITNVIKMCKALNISVDKLIDNNQLISTLNFDNATPIELSKDVIRIPVLGRIPAGTPIEAIEDIIGYEEIPKDWLKGGNEYFALVLEGDSMEPKYQDKDIGIFLKASDCESGQDCCIRINGFDATFKRVKKQENGIMVMPLNENNSTGFSTTFYTNDEIINKPVEIIGIIKQIRRNM